MLHFKVLDVILSRGIPDAHTWCRTVAKLSRYKCGLISRGKVTQLSNKDLSKLCVLLRCTPNELMVLDNRDLNLPPSHPLYALQRQAYEPDLQKLVRQADPQLQQHIMELLSKASNANHAS